jgi:hypothetical protein
VTTIGRVYQNCPATQPPGLSVVWLGSYLGGLRAGLHLGSLTLHGRDIARLHPTAINDVAVREGAWRVTGGELVQVVVVPARHVFILATSPDRHVVVDALDSMQPVAVDPDTGCVVYTRKYSDPAALTPQSGSRLVPGRPTDGDACYYVDGWLESSATIGGPRIRRLAAAIDRSPPAPVSHSCAGVREGAFTKPGPMALWFNYDNRAARVVVARIVNCGRWSSFVTNGTQTRRLNREILTEIPRLWAYLAPHA